MASEPDRSASEPARGRSGRSTRAVWLGAALVVFIVGTLAAFLQPLRSDPFQPVGRLGADWWLRPVEVNAFRRVPAVNANLDAVASVPATTIVWAVGDGGTILESADDGRTWKQVIVDRSTLVPARTAGRPGGEPTAPAGARRPPMAARGGVIALVGEAHAGAPPKPPPAETPINIPLQGDGAGSTGAPRPGPIGAQRQAPPVEQAPQQMLRVPEPNEPAQKTLAPRTPPPYQKAPEQTKAPNAANRAAPPAAKPPVAPRQTPPPAPGLAPDHRRFDATGRLTVALRTVAFADARHGWIGGEGTLLATEDGGVTWSDQPLFDPSLTVSGMHVVDPQRGWLVATSGASGRAFVLATRDGGRTWQRQLEHGGVLLSVRLLSDGLRGWTVGAAGRSPAIYRTGDGGKTWEPASAIPKRDGYVEQTLAAVDATADGQTVWAAGGGGMLVSRDGGRSWTRGRDIDAFLRAVRLSPDGRRGWAVGVSPAGPLVLSTNDAGARWAESTAPCEEGLGLALTATGGVRIVGRRGAVLSTGDGRAWRLEMAGRDGQARPLHVAAGGRRGVVIGGCGTILTTADGGASWRPTASGPRAGPRALAFEPDGARGWIAADGGLFATTDGGSTWGRVPTLGREAIVDVAAASGGRVWAAATNRILASADAGRSWTSIATGGAGILSLHGNAARVLGLGPGGTLYRSEAGTDAAVRSHPELRGAQALHFMPEGIIGWAVGSNGSIARTDDDGRAWRRQDSRVKEALHAVHFVSADTGWAVGGRGTALRTVDGGATWQPTARRPAEVDLVGVSAIGDGRRAWVTGAAGALLFTDDAGATWRSPEHRWYPAPWYYLTWLIVAVLLIPAARRPDDVVAPEPDVADVLVSDRPLLPGDRDVLALDQVAEGLSRFLRNTKTRPPLTIAITGPWGSGKSSLMNLLRARLEDAGLRPVWFNAWHHQKEEHLLASLLQNLRRQAIPPWWHPDGFGFRLRLLLDRGEGRWRGLIVLALAVGSSAGYVAANWTDISTRVAQLIGVGTAGGVLAALAALVTRIPETSSVWDVVVSLVGGGGAIKLARGAWNAVKAFGVSPARLLAVKSGDSSTRGLEEMAGFRHRFAREFGEVTRSLSPRDMVIIVDDLDRCRPANVLEVLEAVNFLVSSGDCFVVIGMEPDRVLRSIGLGHKEVADELLEEEVAQISAPAGAAAGARAIDPGDAERMRRQRRQAFARLYLEKLVNIEIRIPTLTSEAATRLLTPEPAPPAPAFGRTLLAQALALGRRVALPLTLAAVLGGSGWWVAVHVGPSGPQVDVGDGAAAGATGERPGGPVRPGGPPEPAPIPAPSDRTPGLLALPETSRPPGTIAYVPLLALVLVGAWIVWRRAANVVVNDSPEFAAALAAWTPLIHRHGATPRGVKRFLNRVRYYAMRQRPVEPVPSALAGVAAWWRRLSASLGREAPGGAEAPAAGEAARAPGAAERIPEWALVGLAAIEHVHPEWLADDRLFEDPIRFLKGREPAEMLPDEIGANIERYVQWRPSHRAAFLSLSTGVRA